MTPNYAECYHPLIQLGEEWKSTMQDPNLTDSIIITIYATFVCPDESCALHNIPLTKTISTTTRPLIQH